jgi:hypothetical protein
MEPEASDHEQPQSKELTRQMPRPEDVGFSVLEGLDIHHASSPAHALDKIARLSLDTTVDRRDRWVRRLDTIGRVAYDRDARKKAVALLRSEGELLGDSTHDNAHAEKEVLDWVRSVIGNADNAAVLRRVLDQGGRDSMQEAIAAANIVGAKFTDDTNIANAIDSSLELARERYAQEHGGRGYQTAAQRAEIAAAAARVKKLKIH